MDSTGYILVVGGCLHLLSTLRDGNSSLVKIQILSNNKIMGVESFTILLAHHLSCWWVSRGTGTQWKKFHSRSPKRDSFSPPVLGLKIDGYQFSIGTWACCVRINYNVVPPDYCRFVEIVV